MIFHSMILPYSAASVSNLSPYGKIIDCMFDIKNEPKVVPPKLIPSLVEGFNAVANHIYIILFPILLDIFLWFGPFVRIKNLVLPTLLNASDLSAPAYGQDGQAIVETAKEMWTTILDQFNVLYNLRAYPIGIPSLLSYKGVRQNPLGGMQVVELGSSTSAFWLMVALSLLGLVIGSLYFSLIAGVTTQGEKKSVLKLIPAQIVQTLILSVIIFVALLFLSIPAICLISSLVMFLPSLGSLPVGDLRPDVDLGFDANGIFAPWDFFQPVESYHCDYKLDQTGAAVDFHCGSIPHDVDLVGLWT